MFDHYIAVDWAQNNMAIARMTKSAKTVSVIDVKADLKELQFYLKQLNGKKILTFEETTTSQWLYTELKGFVDEIIVCDPYRNKLLNEGGKSDKIDASKLVQLLRGDLLKPVFHSGDEFIYLRKVVSGYDDLIKSGVRLKNQKSALFRGQGKKTNDQLIHPAEIFVLKGLEDGIEIYEKEKKRYESEFNALAKKYKVIQNLKSIPGIGVIGAVKIAAIVVDPKRFPSKGHFFAYCGLIKHEKMSGGRSYGKRNPRYSRTLKSVFKTCTLVAIDGRTDNPILDYYEYLLNIKKLPDFNARHAACRQLAAIALGVMKSNKKYLSKRSSECKTA